MRITDLLKKNGIALNVNVSDKSTAIDKLVSLHEKCGNLKNTAAFKEGILKREEMGTTAVGMEVAIPHAKSDAVKAPALTAITVPNGVDYDAADKKPCKLIFMIAATTDGDVHLEVLARLMQLLMDEEFTAKLKKAKTADEFLSIIDRKETEKFPEEAKAPAKPAKKGYRVLAVTACPTGIAHTYMAAEALVKAGEKMGITVKVETNGSGGAKNVLTAEEIANCDGIIIAADKSVETARFDGKPVYSTKVSDGINKPEELIKKIVNGQAPVFHSDRKAKAEVSGGGNESIGRQLYKHLMNGVSHMLPFVVAGGIFIAIAFLIDAASGVQAAGNSAFGTVNPVAAWFKNIGGYAFNFMIPILAGFIARSIADRPGLLVGFVGGFLATNGATFVDPGAAATIPSGFLGALLAGFAGGYLMLALEKLCDKLPNALEGIKPVLLYPLGGLGIVAVMMCAVNPIMGIVNTGLNSGLIWLYENNLGILLACILGAMMSIDMGGPFNKAAYVFGTGMLTTAATNPEVATVAYQIMACVMIGGMVPPLAIALSTTFFKSRWTAEERKNGVVNYVMGLSFITEGAIPYAASSPLKVIPSCAIGSAVAGGLSWLFGCTLMAPHGGIFVVATIGNPLLYLLALAIGAVVGMILLTIMKRPIDTAKKK
ncbi:fructose-specific PTS transporter subunit EIIC [uncultured Ruminococcus sp.]|uniref:PTS fructose transporter subunit IIABC n=1 Tax=uncultured Ruminococcus sp. TaxID=165186 RepID=UPI002600319F|nr:fructose-specific PTS transporter subunit EIIC [uncultured Ruminococcus sp.]